MRSPSTGILFNNEMDDFATSNSTNAWGLAPSRTNLIGKSLHLQQLVSREIGPDINFLSLAVPGKRPLSSMSPSIILRDDKLWMVTGASGMMAFVVSLIFLY